MITKVHKNAYEITDLKTQKTHKNVPVPLSINAFSPQNGKVHASALTF